MKRGGLGGAILLAAAAVVALALNRAPSPARAPATPPSAVEEPAPQEALPPEPPSTPAPDEHGSGSNSAKLAGARLVGRVADDLGRPVAGAGIWLSKGGGAGEGDIVASTAEDGRYLLDGVDGEERLVGAIAAKHAPSDLRRIAPMTQAVFEIDFTLRRGGGTLALAIDSESADVFIEPVFLENAESGGRRRVEARGSVLVDGLVPEWNLVRVRAPGRAPQTLLTRLPPEGVVDASVKLGEGAVVSGTVRTADGAPAPGARIDIVGWEWAELGVVADAEGAYRMERAPAAVVELRAMGADGAEARALVRLEEGKQHAWDPVPRLPAEISGRVIDEGGAPVSTAITYWPVGSVRPNEIMGLDPDGSFRLRGLPSRAYRIAVWWRGRSGVPPAAEVTAIPGGEPITIVLPRAQGFLRGVITTRNGLPAAGARARTWPTGNEHDDMRARAAADGSFRLGPLPAGTYFLELHLDGEPTLHLDGIEVGADETRELGVVQFAAGGRIRARVVNPSGALFFPYEGPRVRSLDGSVTFVVRQDGDDVVSEELVPGRYLVSGGMAGILEEAEVRAGETTVVELKLRGSGLLEVAALDADGSRTWATFEIRDARGYRIAIDDEPASPLLLRLASGSYTVTATDAAGARGTQEVEIPADGQKTQVALALR